MNEDMHIVKKDATNIKTETLPPNTPVGIHPNYVPIVEDEFNPWEIFQLIIDYRWLIAGFLIIGLSLGAFVTWFMPKKYRAEAILEVNPLDVSIPGGNLSIPGGNLSPQAVAKLIQTDANIREVVLALDLQADKNFLSRQSARNPRGAAIQKIKSNLKAQIERNTNLVRVTYSDTDPKRASNIVNRLVTNFLSRRKQRIVHYVRNKRTILEKLLEKTSSPSSTDTSPRTEEASSLTYRDFFSLLYNYFILKRKEDLEKNIENLYILEKLIDNYISILQKATPPMEPYSPKILLNLLIAALLSLLSAALVIYLREQWKKHQKIKNSEDQSMECDASGE